MKLSFELQNLYVYLLVFVRVGGMIFFNPILSRKNVPSQARAGLTLAVTLVLAPTLLGQAVTVLNGLGLVFTVFKELFVGLACGFILQFFYFLLFMAGDFMDTEFGLAMAKVFDPGTNIQTSISGNLFQLCFILYFFLTNSHLLMLRMIASSFDLVHLGAVVITSEIAQFVMTAFITAFTMAVQLATPFMATLFILDLSMGMLMKVVPQITVFVIQFQLKIMLGFSLLLAFTGPITDFLQNYLDTMLTHMQGLLQLFAGS